MLLPPTAPLRASRKLILVVADTTNLVTGLRVEGLLLRVCLSQVVSPGGGRLGPLFTSLDFRAENKGPIGAAASSLGHRDADRGHLRTKQVLPMAELFSQPRITSL